MKPKLLDILPLPHRAVSACVDINTSPSIAWQVLSDFSAYGAWSPIIKRIEGEFAVDAQLKFSGEWTANETSYRYVKLRKIETDQKLVWGHRLPWHLFDGEHEFRIQETHNGCVLNNTETFSGLLVPLLVKKSLISQQLANFKRFNAAFKQRCESLSR